MPQRYRDLIRFKVAGAIYVMDSLPFGWAHSLVLANLSLQHPGQVILVQYLDDILVVSHDRQLLAHNIYLVC